MRDYAILFVLAACIAAAGCGSKKSNDPGREKSTAKRPAEAGTAKTSNPDPEKPAVPEKSPAHRKLLTDLVNEKIPRSPCRKDGMEAITGWKVADWEDAASYKRFREKKTGLVMMYLGTGGGSKGKAAAIYTKNLSLAPKGTLKAAVYNYGEKPVDLAVAFWFSDGWVYYESKPRRIPTYSWTKVAFSLAAADFKTASSKWQHNASLWKHEDTRQIAVLLYHRGGPAQVLIDGLTVDQAPRPKPKPQPQPKAKPEKRAKKSGPPPAKAPPNTEKTGKKQ